MNYQVQIKNSETSGWILSKPYKRKQDAELQLALVAMNNKGCIARLVTARNGKLVILMVIEG